MPFKARPTDVLRLFSISLYHLSAHAFPNPACTLQSAAHHLPSFSPAPHLLVTCSHFSLSVRLSGSAFGFSYLKTLIEMSLCPCRVDFASSEAAFMVTQLELSFGRQVAFTKCTAPSSNINILIKNETKCYQSISAFKFQSIDDH